MRDVVMKLTVDLVIPSIVVAVLAVSCGYLLFTGALHDEDALVGTYDQVYTLAAYYDEDGYHYSPETDYKLNFDITKVSNGFVYAETSDGPIVGLLIGENRFTYSQIVDGNIRSGFIYKIDDYLVTQYTGINEDGHSFAYVSVLVQPGWKPVSDPLTLFPKISEDYMRGWDSAIAYYYDGSLSDDDEECYQNITDTFTFEIDDSGYGLVFYNVERTYADGSGSERFYYSGIYIGDGIIQAVTYKPGTENDLIKDTVILTDKAVYTSSADYVEATADKEGYSRIYVVDYADVYSDLNPVPKIPTYNPDTSDPDDHWYEGTRWITDSSGQYQMVDSSRIFYDQWQGRGIITSMSENKEYTSKWLIVNSGGSVMGFTSYKNSEGVMYSYSYFEDSLTKLTTVTTRCNNDGSVDAVRQVMYLR